FVSLAFVGSAFVSTTRDQLAAVSSRYVRDRLRSKDGNQMDSQHRIVETSRAGLTNNLRVVFQPFIGISFESCQLSRLRLLERRQIPFCQFQLDFLCCKVCDPT